MKLRFDGVRSMEPRDAAQPGPCPTVRKTVGDEIDVMADAYMADPGLCQRMLPLLNLQPALVGRAGDSR